ncbi:hypothetical protein COLU111180_09310 [Cohnella lubricantis]|uniref:Uncharacterized protein n=1 Tax=Cohnella lubricantis TaxID=2163172 RepID=A0A841TAA2_9BACL|nr:hypothetical protein [Cohnella lubricantis]MBB6676955.1 hypothetical protein [Cohnella lubricantis]MBP2118360.1 hypothetical protein [Cohnella lubricantis]
MARDMARGGSSEGGRGRRGMHGDLNGRRGGRRKHDDPDGRPERGANCAQTFRRGRAIAFLERLEGMRNTLAKQLREPEFDSIRPVICGELKAIDTVIQAFVQTFELQEPSEARQEPKLDEGEGMQSET